MTVYVVQIYDGWEWQNEAIFSKLESAREFVLERFEEEKDRYDEDVYNEYLDIFQDENWIHNFAAIETWEVDA